MRWDMCRIVKALALLAAVVLLTLTPAVALAQAVLAGTVKDSSGAVLPGVAVEATSPALIEKVRAAVTDGTGQYRIEDLRPGTYTVTFTLQGFSTVKREGIELTGVVHRDDQRGAEGRHARRNGHRLRRNADRRRPERETADDAEQRHHQGHARPSRNYSALLIVVPGVVTSNNDVATGPVTTQIPDPRRPQQREPSHGRWADVGNPAGGNQPPNYVADVGNAQEVTLHDLRRAGRVGDGRPGHEHRAEDRRQHRAGVALLQRHGRALQANNFTQALRGRRPPGADAADQGLGHQRGDRRPDQEGSRVVLPERAHPGQHESIANMYYNLNAGDPTKWTYVPDFSRPEYSDRTWENASLRLTWQATPRNKIGAFWDEQAICRKCTGTTLGHHRLRRGSRPRRSASARRSRCACRR